MKPTFVYRTPPQYGAPQLYRQRRLTTLGPPGVYSVSPGTFADAQTGIVISGAGFLAAQGGGSVVISPIDNPAGDPPVTVSPVSSATFAATTGTTGGTITIPTVAVDDILIVLFVSRDHTSGTAQPTVTDNDTGGNTWTQKATSTDRTLQLWWKRSTSATSGKTVTVAGAVGSCTGGLSAFRDCLASGDPLTNVAVEDNSSGDESHAGFTPTHAGSMVCFGVVNPTNDTLDVTSLAAATLGTMEPELWNRLSTGGSDCYAIFTALASPGGPTATGNFTWSQTNSVTRSVAFAIRPRVTAGAAVAQTVTAWSDTQITFTASKSTLALSTPLYLFVTNSNGASNASGYSVQFVTATVIAGTVDSIVITERTASVKLSRNVSAALDTLALTENSATLKLSRNVVAALDALSMAEQGATLKLSRNISAALDTLSLSELSASTVLGFTINASADALALTERLATVNRGLVIAAQALVLTLSEQAAVQKLSRNISAGADALSLVEVAAAINRAVALAAGLDTLTLSERAATTRLAKAVVAGLDALALTERAATMALDKSVAAVVNALLLSERAATVVSSSSLNAGFDALALTERVAAINAERGILALADALAITEHAASAAMGTQIQAATDALLLAELNAVVLQAMAILANADTLALTERLAAANRETDVLVSVDALSFSESQAALTTAIDIIAVLDQLTLTERQAIVEGQTQVIAVVARRILTVAARKSSLAAAIRQSTVTATSRASVARVQSRAAVKSVESRDPTITVH